MRLALYGVSGTKYVGDATLSGDVYGVENCWMYFQHNPTIGVQATNTVKVYSENVEATISLDP